jgi:2-amino-4-hydroxy-6-hydroxymethyldihydropteridine diphosphokinase
MSVGYVLSLGSSHHHGERIVALVTEALNQHPEVKVVAHSRIFPNPSFGLKYQRTCVNSCVVIKTSLSPMALHWHLRSLETRFGRVRSAPNAARTIDIDIIYSPKLTYQSTSLLIPHAKILKRDFFLVPLSEALNRAGLPTPFVFKSLACLMRGTFKSIGPREYWKVRC